MRGRSIKREISTQQNNEKGITLVALVVTIVVLLILAGITVTMLFSENGIIKKAQQAAENTNREEIIGRIRNDILAKRTETLEKITETDLKKILENYGTLSDNGEESILDKTLETSVGKINVRDIYDGPIAKAEVITCYFNNKPVSFEKGIEWVWTTADVTGVYLSGEPWSSLISGVQLLKGKNAVLGEPVKIEIYAGSICEEVSLYRTEGEVKNIKVKWGEPLKDGVHYFTYET